MPVAVVTSQARSVETQDQAGLTKADLADQALKTLPLGAGGAGLSQVVIDDRNAFTRPTESDRAIYQVILELRALLMMADLASRGLTYVDISKLGLTYLLQSAGNALSVHSFKRPAL